MTLWTGFSEQVQVDKLHDALERQLSSICTQCRIYGCAPGMQIRTTDNPILIVEKKARYDKSLSTLHSFAGPHCAIQTRRRRVCTC